MEINIKDYLSESEIKQICVDHLRAQLAAGGERLVTNMAYEAAFSIIDEAFDEESKKLLKARVKTVLNKVDNFELFRKKNAWDSEDSVAYSALQEAVRDNIPKLHARVAETMEAYPISDELFKNSDLMAEVLVTMLRKGFGKE